MKEQHCSLKDAKGLCLQMPFTCQLFSDVWARHVTCMFCNLAFVDSDSYNGAVKYLWKP